jgi:hypothetical protein
MTTTSAAGEEKLTWQNTHSHATMGNELTSYRASNNSQDKAPPVTDAKEPDPSIWVLEATDNGHHITSHFLASHANPLGPNSTGQSAPESHLRLGDTPQPYHRIRQNWVLPLLRTVRPKGFETQILDRTASKQGKNTPSGTFWHLCPRDFSNWKQSDGAFDHS